MQETRRQRLAAVIQQELSTVISREIKDPRVPPLTLTQVEVTSDGSQATLYVMLLGSDPGPEGTEAEHKRAAKRTAEAIAGLNSASGFLRRHLAAVLTIRHIPTLIFREDRGLANTNRVHELLKKIHSAEPGPGPGPDDDGQGSGTS
jgi:ribosome-binding factor A